MKDETKDDFQREASRVWKKMHWVVSHGYNRVLTEEVEKMMNSGCKC